MRARRRPRRTHARARARRFRAGRHADRVQDQVARSLAQLESGPPLGHRQGQSPASPASLRRRAARRARSGRLASQRLGCGRQGLRTGARPPAGRWGSCSGDWGNARWIDYPGRTENQPLPIFARHFDVQGNVAQARLYVSGIGVQQATVNGQSLTDEVLAPGYSNWQLAAEYRTYDVTDELVNGSNTVGVALGNGTAYVRRSVKNAAVGRTAPYSWWQSLLKGSGTLTEAAAAGATNVMPSSTANYHLGGTINIDTGNGGDRLESGSSRTSAPRPPPSRHRTSSAARPRPSLTGANWIWSTPERTPARHRHRATCARLHGRRPAPWRAPPLRVNGDDGHTRT